MYKILARQFNARPAEYRSDGDRIGVRATNIAVNPKDEVYVLCLRIEKFTS